MLRLIQIAMLPLTSARAKTNGRVAPDGHRGDEAEICGPIEIRLLGLNRCGICGVETCRGKEAEKEEG